MKNSRNTPALAALAVALCLLPAAAQAHPGHSGSFSTGAAHPFLGWDHLLAMIAVGLWAAQLGNRARWAVPGAFVAMMTLGGVLGMTGLRLPFVEPAILSSVMIFGLLVFAACRMPLGASVAMVSVFALFHGHAHGTELPLNASGLLYTSGFALATAALHGFGIAAASLSLSKLQAPVVLRCAGAAIALAGAVLTFR